MLFRAAAVVLFSLPTVRAQDPPVPYPLETSGGRWTGYEPVGEIPGLAIPQLQRHGDELLVSKSHSFSVDRLTGQVNPSPRPAFPSAQEFIAADGDSPVFWTRPWGEDPARPFFTRDWSTGEKLGEATLPPGISPAYLDAHGMVAVTGLSILATDSTGGSVRQATFADLGLSGYQFKVTGCERWLALSYLTGSASRLAILDRATLALAGDHVSVGDQITMDGDLLAARKVYPWSAAVAFLYQLPSLSPVRGVANESPTNDGARFLKLVEGNLWVLQQVSDQAGCRFLQYDVSDLPNVRLRHRVSPPGQVLPTPGLDLTWVAGENHLGWLDSVSTLWIWNRDPGNDPYQPLLRIEPWREGPEGGVALARLSISDTVDRPVEVSLRARSGSAVEGSDFAPWAETVTIPAGETYALAEVPLLADTILEENECFEIVIEQVTGALAENSRAPLVVAGNGYNFEHNPPAPAGGKLNWSHIYGSDGRVLVGLASVEMPAAGVSAGLVIADLETGEVIANHAGTSWAPNSWKCEFRDNLVVIVAYGYLSVYRTDTGIRVANWPLSDHEVVGLVDTDRILTRPNHREVRLHRVSDGSLLASTPVTEATSIALSEDARDGSPATIFAYHSGRAQSERLSVNRLSELDRETLAATELSSWRSFSQPGGDYHEKILAVWQDRLLISVNRGLTAVDRHTGAPLWHLPAAVNGTTLYGHAMTGNVMALQGLFTGAADSANAVHFVDLGSGVVIEKITPDQLNPNSSWWATSVFAYDEGWVISSRSKSIRVLKTPVRPNVNLVAPVIQDNEATTLRAVPREGFTGTRPIRISEFEFIGEDRDADERLLGGLPVDLELDSDGVDFTVAATRPVNGFENTWLRATSPGRETLLSGALRVVVDDHSTKVPNGAFTTGGPVRGTRARSVAVSAQLLAVGFPLELLPDGSRTGVVDVYERLTGKFVRSIEAPAGTEGKRFGHALGVSGGKVVVGAPGDRTMGRAFVYDGTTGALIQELKQKGKAGQFGWDIQANDRWIAVSAPGPSRPVTSEAMRKQAGTVMVFDAVTLKPGFAKTTKGEFLGSSIALTGDRLHAAAPGARLKKLWNVGMVRSYSLPKGKPAGTIMSREPRAHEAFGSPVAASDGVVVIGRVFDREVDAGALHVHDLSGSDFPAYHAMPGDPFATQRVLVHDGWMIGGGDTLRFYRAGNTRPVASRQIADPGGPVVYPPPYFSLSNLAAYGSVLYWADHAPKIMPLPAVPETPVAATDPAAPDANGDGIIDEIDLLFHHRGDSGLPARASLGESGPEGRVFRIQADDNIPAAMDLWFEMSTDLERWETVLEWRHDDPGWRDAAGVELPRQEENAARTEVRSGSDRVFFRTRALSR